MNEEILKHKWKIVDEEDGKTISVVVDIELEPGYHYWKIANMYNNEFDRVFLEYSVKLHNESLKSNHSTYTDKHVE